VPPPLCLRKRGLKKKKGQGGTNLNSMRILRFDTRSGCAKKKTRKNKPKNVDKGPGRGGGKILSPSIAKCGKKSGVSHLGCILTERGKRYVRNSKLTGVLLQAKSRTLR